MKSGFSQIFLADAVDFPEKLFQGFQQFRHSAGLFLGDFQCGEEGVSQFRRRMVMQEMPEVENLSSQMAFLFQGAIEELAEIVVVFQPAFLGMAVFPVFDCGSGDAQESSHLLLAHGKPSPR